MKTLIIYNSPILFEILDEIKVNLKFKILVFEKKMMNDPYFNNPENYVLISSSNNDKKNCHVLDGPKKIEKILEQINVLFLSNKFSAQSSVKIGKYYLNLNSRTIHNDISDLNLTEREAELIMFIKNNKFVNLKTLQEKVWKHSSELETHTVETHIYRLRKKFLEVFNDENFIHHDKRGYYLN